MSVSILLILAWNNCSLIIKEPKEEEQASNCHLSDDYRKHSTPILRTHLHTPQHKSQFPKQGIFFFIVFFFSLFSEVTISVSFAVAIKALVVTNSTSLSLFCITYSLETYPLPRIDHLKAISLTLWRDKGEIDTPTCAFRVFGGR